MNVFLDSFLDCSRSLPFFTSDFNYKPISMLSQPARCSFRDQVCLSCVSQMVLWFWPLIRLLLSAEPYQFIRLEVHATRRQPLSRMWVFVCFYTYLDSECVLLSTSPLPRRFWQAGLWRAGGKGEVLLLLSSALAATPWLLGLPCLAGSLDQQGRHWMAA